MRHPVTRAMLHAEQSSLTVPPHARGFLRSYGQRAKTRLWSSCVETPTTLTTADFQVARRVSVTEQAVTARARLHPREASRQAAKQCPPLVAGTSPLTSDTACQSHTLTLNEPCCDRKSLSINASTPRSTTPYPGKFARFSLRKDYWRSALYD